MTEQRRDDIAKLEALHAQRAGGRVFIHLAEAYRRAGEMERARAVVEEGLSNHGEYASARIVHGRILRELAKPEEAAEEFRAALDIDPHNLVALRALGELRRDAGDAAGAREYFHQLLLLDPGDEDVDRAVRDLEASAGPEFEVDDAGWGEDVDLLEVGATAGLGEAEVDAADDEDEAWAAESWAEVDLSTGADIEPEESGGSEEAEQEEAEQEEALMVGEWATLLPDSEDEELQSEPADAADEDVPGADSVEVGDFQGVDIEDIDPANIEVDEVGVEDVHVEDVDVEDVDVEDVDVEDVDVGDVEDLDVGDVDVVDVEDIEDVEDVDVPEVGVKVIDVEDVEAERLDSPALDTAGVDFEDVGPAYDEEIGDPDAGAVEDREETELVELDEDVEDVEDVEEAPASVTVEPTSEERERGAEVATETMADLYARQGLHEHAAEVYQKLLNARPGDAGLEEKLEESRRQLTASPGEQTAEPAAEPESVTTEHEEAQEAQEAQEPDLAAAEFVEMSELTAGDGGTDAAAQSDAVEGGDRQTVDDYFTRLLSWRPAEEEFTRTLDLSRDAEYLGGGPAAEGVTADGAAAGSQAAEVPAPNSRDADEAATNSHDTDEAAAEPESGDEDLEVFRSWLQSLKR